GCEDVHGLAARLWKRTLARVNEQKNTIHHRQCALDFPSEVTVTWRIHDIDFDSVIPDARCLGENRDSALALKIIRVQNALHYFLVYPENTALPQHRIDKCRLSVIDVRNDGYVANCIVRHNLPSYR